MPLPSCVSCTVVASTRVPPPLNEEKELTMNQSMRVAEVLESALYVEDLTAAEQFYTKVLGLTFYSKLEGRHVFLRCGQRMVLLFNAEATAVSAGGANR